MRSATCDEQPSQSSLTNKGIYPATNVNKTRVFD